MHQGTRDTYNQSAGSLSQHYDEIGPREGDVQLAFALAEDPENARVLEIGCGNGRDARAILRRTPFYTGIDTSKEMIQLAQAKSPKGHFEVADATTYDYNGPYDLVFAFAPFRHMTIEEVATVMRKVYESIRVGGIFYISSNYGDTYREALRADEYGTRKIHLYNPDIIQKHTPPKFKKVEEMHDLVDGQPWFDVAFKKVR